LLLMILKQRTPAMEMLKLGGGKVALIDLEGKRFLTGEPRKGASINQPRKDREKKRYPINCT